MIAAFHHDLFHKRTGLVWVVIYSRKNGFAKEFKQKSMEVRF